MEPSVKVAPSMPTSFNSFEGYSGPTTSDCKSQLMSVHPLKQSEQNYGANRHSINMNILRSREGIAAPLKITMELHSVNKVGRLPFLQSSNALHDSLTGRDISIDFSDVLGTADFSETIRQPHAVVEKHLGIF